MPNIDENLFHAEVTAARRLPAVEGAKATPIEMRARLVK